MTAPTLSAVRARAGQIGGIARRLKLSPERRSEIARQAVLARYRKSTKKARVLAARKAVQARWAKARARGEAGGR